MLRRYQHLWPELSSRDDVTVDRRLVSDWRELLMEFPERFMIGTDTHAADRWNVIGSHAASVRAWLAELPAEVAERIAYRNGETLLTAAFSARR